MIRNILHCHAQRSECLESLAAALRVQLQRSLAQQPRARALLPGGSSPQALLPLLAPHLDSCRIDLSPSDERWVPAQAVESNWQLLHQGLPQANCLDPRQGATLAQAAQGWAEQLSTWLPFSAVLLGMGEDGHIASLFPGMPGLAAALDPHAAPAALPALAPQEPRERLSLNLAMLQRGQWLGLLAFGERKRELIDAVLADQSEARELPLYAWLQRSPLPVNIYWAP
ncbi:6-phosphogluconolactonase [Pseudomonas leptonychotis]|jgi:6-phosphogluconolactonase|uniref:6-phosphogluconolactonase n=1 Tax=Pseudomonas leptonychotis TaxID=2448482 RepID=A0A4T1ZTE1_9PSED|nr:6-phosphogluconolactonase [Pseudomonas leptonychotis]TIH06659.1 6-phosphogluconolactonase [Pseudomonas leptonychotis]